MFTKKDIIEMFTENNGINFVISTDNGKYYALNIKNRSDECGIVHTFKDTMSIESLHDNYMVLTVSFNNCSTMQNVYLPYNRIRDISFITYNNQDESTPVEIAENILFK